ncbi:FitA-like ribbon-helix-helix domain-containing protein [Cyanobium sp. ULC084]|nr:MAG: toxin-antitoxin system [Cyanobium sp.]
MAQLLVRNLDLSVKEALQRRALRHGHSMEEEARLILAKAAENEHVEPEGTGLGSQIAALFKGAGLDEPIAEWRGQEAEAAVFEA